MEITIDTSITFQNILTSGVPTGDDVKFVSATGVLTFGRALEAGEYIRGLFQ